MLKYALIALLLLCGCAVYLPEATKQYEVTEVTYCVHFEFSCMPSFDSGGGMDCSTQPVSGKQLARIRRTARKYFYRKHPETIYTEVNSEIIKELSECK